MSIAKTEFPENENRTLPFSSGSKNSANLTWFGSSLDINMSENSDNCATPDPYLRSNDRTQAMTEHVAIQHGSAEACSTESTHLTVG